MRLIDLTDKRFGKLVVIRRIQNKGNQPMWECACDCGNRVVVSGGHLRSGHTRSCGCFHLQRQKEWNFKHGKVNHPLYRVWRGIIDRTTLPNNKAYHCYGGRGIAMNQKWKDDFRNFYDWALDSGYKKGLSIDRIDVNGNYEPGNCRWVTQKVNCNNKRKNVRISFNGETHTATEWSEITGVNLGTLLARYHKNWSVEEILYGRGGSR